MWFGNHSISFSIAGTGTGFGGSVLLGPPTNLSFKVIAGFPVITQANCVNVNVVHVGQNFIHLIINLPTVYVVNLGQGWIPKYATFQILHNVKYRANNRLVLAQSHGDGHWDNSSLTTLSKP
jgi:hypothetical protein